VLTKSAEQIADAPAPFWRRLRDALAEQHPYWAVPLLRSAETRRGAVRPGALGVSGRAVSAVEPGQGSAVVSAPAWASVERARSRLLPPSSGG